MEEIKPVTPTAVMQAQMHRDFLRAHYEKLEPLLSEEEKYKSGASKTPTELSKALAFFEAESALLHNYLQQLTNTKSTGYNQALLASPAFKALPIILLKRPETSSGISRELGEMCANLQNTSAFFGLKTKTKAPFVELDQEGLNFYWDTAETQAKFAELLRDSGIRVTCTEKNIAQDVLENLDKNVQNQYQNAKHTVTVSHLDVKKLLLLFQYPPQNIEKTMEDFYRGNPDQNQKIYQRDIKLDRAQCLATAAEKAPCVQSPTDQPSVSLTVEKMVLKGEEALLSVGVNVHPAQNPPENRPPHHFVILFDDSGSMRGDRTTTANKALQNFISSIQDDNALVSLQAFNQKNSYHRSKASDLKALIKSSTFKQIQATGEGTPMLEILHDSAVFFRKSPAELVIPEETLNNATIVLLTDGEPASDLSGDAQDAVMLMHASSNEKKKQDVIRKVSQRTGNSAGVSYGTQEISCENLPVVYSIGIGKDGEAFVESLAKELDCPYVFINEDQAKQKTGESVDTLDIQLTQAFQTIHAMAEGRVPSVLITVSYTDPTTKEKKSLIQRERNLLVGNQRKIHLAIPAGAKDINVSVISEMGEKVAQVKNCPDFTVSSVNKTEYVQQEFIKIQEDFEKKRATIVAGATKTVPNELLNSYNFQNSTKTAEDQFDSNTIYYSATVKEGKIHLVAVLSKNCSAELFLDKDFLKANLAENVFRSFTPSNPNQAKTRFFSPNFSDVCDKINSGQCVSTIVKPLLKKNPLFYKLVSPDLVDTQKEIETLSKDTIQKIKALKASLPKDSPLSAEMDAYCDTVTQTANNFDTDKTVQASVNTHFATQYTQSRFVRQIQPATMIEDPIFGRINERNFGQDDLFGDDVLEITPKTLKEKDRFGATPLIAALAQLTDPTNNNEADKKSLRAFILEKLLPQDAQDCLAVDIKGNTALHRAVWGGEKEIAVALIGRAKTFNALEDLKRLRNQNHVGATKGETFLDNIHQTVRLKPDDKKTLISACLEQVSEEKLEELKLGKGFDWDKLTNFIKTNPTACNQHIGENLCTMLMEIVVRFDNNREYDKTVEEFIVKQIQTNEALLLDEPDLHGNTLLHYCLRNTRTLGIAEAIILKAIQNGTIEAVLFARNANKETAIMAWMEGYRKLLDRNNDKGKEIEAADRSEKHAEQDEIDQFYIDTPQTKAEKFFHIYTLVESYLSDMQKAEMGHYQDCFKQGSSTFEAVQKSPVLRCRQVLSDCSTLKLAIFNSQKDNEHQKSLAQLDDLIKWMYQALETKGNVSEIIQTILKCIEDDQNAIKKFENSDIKAKYWAAYHALAMASLSQRRMAVMDKLSASSGADEKKKMDANVQKKLQKKEQEARWNTVMMEKIGKILQASDEELQASDLTPEKIQEISKIQAFFSDLFYHFPIYSSDQDYLEKLTKIKELVVNESYQEVEILGKIGEEVKKALSEPEKEVEELKLKEGVPQNEQGVAGGQDTNNTVIPVGLGAETSDSESSEEEGMPVLRTSINPLDSTATQKTQDEVADIKDFMCKNMEQKFTEFYKKRWNFCGFSKPVIDQNNLQKMINDWNKAEVNTNLAVVMLLYKQLDFVCQHSNYGGPYEKDSKLQAFRQGTSRKILVDIKKQLVEQYKDPLQDLISAYDIIYTELHQYLSRYQHSFDKKTVFGEDGISGWAGQLLEAYKNGPDGKINTVINKIKTDNNITEKNTGSTHALNKIAEKLGKLKMDRISPSTATPTATLIS